MSRILYHQIWIYFSQWQYDHVKAMLISATLRATIPQILFLTRAFRQSHLLFSSSPAWSWSCRPPPWSRGRSSTPAPSTARWTTSTWPKDSILVKEKSGRVKWDIIWIWQWQSSVAQGATRHHLPPKGAKQPGLFLVHCQPGHFSAGCRGLISSIF